MPKQAAPNGANVDFKTLGQGRFEVRLPTGITPSVAARAIFAARRGMAVDSTISGGFPGERKETPWNKVCRLAREAGLEGEAMGAFERALVEFAEHRDAGSLERSDDDESDPDADPENALDQEGAEPWWNDPEQRSRHWRATDKFLRKRGVSDEDLEELRPKWERHFGKLPRNALEGGYGGEARDRKHARDRARRRQAMDRWGPDAARLDAGSPLESRYGERPQALRREPISQASLDRWPDAARIIG